MMENYYDRKTRCRSKGRSNFRRTAVEIRWRNAFVREIPPPRPTRSRFEVRPPLKPVLNGRDFSGWRTAGQLRDRRWRRPLWQEHRAARSSPPNTRLCARLSSQAAPAANNGLAIRYPGKGDTAYDGMCELQVLDAQPRGRDQPEDRSAHRPTVPLYGMPSPPADSNARSVMEL